MLKLFQEWGREEIKENGEGEEFKKDTFCCYTIRIFINAIMHPYTAQQ
jgi:hypothetical protein